MWSQYDFEDIEQLYLEDAEDYTGDHPHKELARTLLISAHNLVDFRNEIERTGGGAVGKEHQMQLIYLRRGMQALLSLYWLTKHHCYSAAYGRVRFLLELYLVVREWNREKEDTKQTWIEMEKEIAEGDYGPYETLPLTEYFSGKRRQLKGDLAKEEELYGEMYDRISNLGSHPHSIRSSWHDGAWDRVQEQDVLQLGLIFAYALAAQYIRTFEDSEIEATVRERMDDVIVQVLFALGDLPRFLDEDLEFGSQI